MLHLNLTLENHTPHHTHHFTFSLNLTQFSKNNERERTNPFAR